jgi:tyrosine-protein kinase Etk/Wzc
MENESLEARTAGQPFRVGKLLALSFKNWHWFFISVFTIIGGASIYLRYATPFYKIKASILVRDDTKGSDFGEAIGIQGLDLPIGKSNVDNEVEVLRSRSLAENVVNGLQLYVTYFSTGDVKTSEIYDQRPVTLDFIRLSPDAAKKEFEKYEIRLVKATEFILTQSVRRWVGHFGDTLKLPQGQAILHKTHSPYIRENKYTIIVSPIAQAVRNYQKALSVTPANKMVSMINLSWVDALPEKGEAILDRHLKTFLSKSAEDKNRIADSTISFIDRNLETVMGEMRHIEQEMTRFRRDHHLADLPESGRTLVQNHAKIEQELAESEVQLGMLRSLQEYLQNNPGAMVPASLMISEGSFSELINRHNELLALRSSALRDRTESHPYVAKLDAQIPQLVTAINHGIEEYRKAAAARNTVLSARESASLTRMDRIPRKQEVMTDYSRQQQIREELYLFLARKRLETSLSRSSTQGSGRIIDSAKADTLPDHPKRSLTLLVALLIGLGIPTATIYLRHVGDERIWYKTEVYNLTTAPVLARIGHAPRLRKKALSKILSKRLSEQFRLLRTELLQYLAPGEKVIIVSSGSGGEGKSFISIHLGHALALGGKRTLLIELNLRRPVLASHFGLRTQGVTDFLLSKPDKEALIQRANDSIPLDILASGSIHENPADLLLDPKLEILIRTLSHRYDYIIIDTPPIGMMADASILTPIANATLIVVRKQLANRSFLLAMQRWIDQKKLPKIGLVLNDFEDPSDQIYDLGA